VTAVRHWRGLPGMVAVLALAGCAALRPDPGPPDEAAWAQHHLELAEVDHWTLEGRAALRTPQDGWSASLRWDQDGRWMDFRLRGPVGMGTTRMRGDPDWMVIENSRGEVWGTPDPERELELQTGWRVPIGHLRWWILGIPAPDEPAETRVDSEGRLAWMEQAGWRIEYGGYSRVERYVLPDRVTVENGDVRLRVVIRSWSVEAGQGG
jgi:outer membrane lipoprotein LolB